MNGKLLSCSGGYLFPFLQKRIYKCLRSHKQTETFLSLQQFLITQMIHFTAIKGFKLVCLQKQEWIVGAKDGMKEHSMHNDC